jgi:thiamine monophosphate synthase
MKSATPFRLYYRLETLQNLAELEIQLTALIQAGIHGIIINPNTENFDVRVLEKIQLHCNSQIEVYLEDAFELAIQYNFKGVILSEQNDSVNDIRKSNPNIKIGSKATNLVECKNWELQKIDFIEFCPPSNQQTTPFTKQILGAESFTKIFPKEEAYGWMILSLNLPVFASGIHRLDSLKELIETSSVVGAIISDQFEPKISREKSVREILK